MVDAARIVFAFQNIPTNATIRVLDREA